MIEESIRTALRLRHRRIVVVHDESEAAEFVDYARELGVRFDSGVVLYEEPVDFPGESVSYEESQKLLGRTFDYALIDMRKSVLPEICRGIETVSGGGMVFLLTPKGLKRDPKEDRLHKEFLVPPWTEAGDAFLRRFSRILKNARGAIFWEERKANPFPTEAPPRRPIVIPKERVFPIEVYRMAKTQDQVEAIKAIERLRKADNRSVVITADRGRGKSAAVGIGLAALMHHIATRRNKRAVALLTAPHVENVQVLLQFFGATMKILGEKVKRYRDSRGLLEGAAGKSYYVRYMPPSIALSEGKDYYHVIVVDEASAVPIHVVESLLRRSRRFIFSSTISGYEGLGRTFAIRLLKRLEERTKLKRVEMEEPIRYNAGDPVERFIYDAFLLDVDLEEITEEDKRLIEEKAYEHKFLDKTRLETIEDETLRRIRAIMVYAHYRNNPKDLILLLDAPHHQAYYTKLKNGKVLAVAQIAIEGEIPEELSRRILTGETDTPGHLIPNILARMYGFEPTLRLRGARIVRIAVHPSVQRRGIGSSLTQYIAKDDRLGIKRLGSAFGATEELLRFRRRNGFFAVYLSPRRNPISGEYSAIVLMPLSEEVDVGYLTEEFMEYLIWTLPRTYRDMEIGIVKELLEMRPYKKKSRLELTRAQKHRLRMFLNGYAPRSVVKDASVKIARRYAISYGTEDLTRNEAAAVIGLLLQNRSLEDLRRARELRTREPFTVLKSAIRKMVKKSDLEL